MGSAGDGGGDRPGWRWGVADRAAAVRLGWPEPDERRSDQTALRIEPCEPRDPVAAPTGGEPADLCLAMLCTRHFLPFARTAVQAFLEHHPDAIPVVLVVDADHPCDIEIDGAEIRTGREVVGARFPFLLLKYTGFEICAASKSYLLEHLVDSGRFRKIVFLDADVLVMSPMTALLEGLDDHDFVACPHLVAPFPLRPSAPERPSLGEVASVGILNTGIIGVRSGPAAKRFLATWREMVSAPGAFSGRESPQTEQIAFNWVISFGPDVQVLTDTAYNVAYWNLHERTLGCGSLEPRPSATPPFTVDGRPLVAFHFSGFVPAKPRVLSVHDGRHSLYLLPTVARLISHYMDRLSANGLPQDGLDDYSMDRLPSGVSLGPVVRDTFKALEATLDVSSDPWTDEGERRYCAALVRPIQGSDSLLPAVLKTIYEQGSWLRSYSPDADLRPERAIEWFMAHGLRAFGLESLVDLHRACLPGASTVEELGYLAEVRPELFTELPSPLGGDRHALVGSLAAAGMFPESERLLLLGTDHFDLGSMYLARRVWETEPGLRERFPSPLHEDAGAYSDWLSAARDQGLAIPAHVPAMVSERAGGRSMARVLSRVLSSWTLQSTAPLAFVGLGTETMARSLLAALCHELEYDADDVVALLWTVDIEPWRGVAPTLELPIHRVRDPSSFEEHGQDEILAPVLGDSRMRAELAAYRERFAGERHSPRPGPDGPGCAVVSVLQVDPGPALPRIGPIPADGLRAGVNLFGPTRSPIGLGAMARGISSAVRSLGLPLAENVVGSDAMDRDVSLDHFLKTYDHRLATNLFVTVPHFHDRPLGLQPRRVLDGRRNIAYLAWEQQDHHPDWREVYADFDEIWSLSSFAATSLARSMERPVLTVPCVVELADLPSEPSKEQVGLDPAECHFLYVFDANSSIVRKNPEAAIAAFSSAFRYSDAARLLIRVTNAHRRVHWPKLARLRTMAADCGARVSFVSGELSRVQILGLLAAVDCYVSLHRAEGFGYTCAEAMALRRPVIASRYSGNLDFMDDGNSLLVDCKEVEVEEADGPFVRGSVWAEPSSEHAAAHMRAVFRDEISADLVNRARETIGTQLSPNAIGRKIAGRIGGGESS